MIHKLLIVEDNRAHMEALCKIIDDLHKDIQIYQAYDTGTASKIALETHISIFIIDIILDTQQPGDVSGLSFAREIRGISKYKFSPLIFITSLEDPKLHSYSQIHCFDYIEKPFSALRVSETILDALEFPVREPEDKYVYFRKDGIVYSKAIKDIVYIESSRRKIKIYCRNDELEIPNKTCKEILKELDSQLFIQCSRYCIVNRKYIEQIDYGNRYIRLRYLKQPVEIGITMKKAFRNQMENE